MSMRQLSPYLIVYIVAAVNSVTYHIAEKK